MISTVSGRRYVYKSVKCDGCTKRVYLGGDYIGSLAAQAFEAEQLERESEAASGPLLELACKPVQGLDDGVGLALNAALLASGFHKDPNKRWRKRREG